MSISSNSLFHFTSSMNKLFNMLNGGLSPAYCWEQLNIKDKNLSQGVPLISFCDIPLSQVKEHLVRYGNYGIGFTLDWGIRNGLNPIFYIDDQSVVSKEIISIGDYVVDLLTQMIKKKDTVKSKPTISKELMLSYLTIICNSKNYQGDLNRKGKVYKNYRFYDEREWRYIPDFTKIPVLLEYEKFEEQRGKSKEKPLLNDNKLTFSTSDIKYILVKNDEDLNKLLEYLHSIKFVGESHKDVEILGTKIITAKQIIEDF